MDLNKYLMTQRDGNDPMVYENRTFPLAKRIKCADGFSLSVQATHGAYCSPRINMGPWYAVEVGYPSDTPEYIIEYAENSDKPTDTVYPYVPIELVEKLIDDHGGMSANAGIQGSARSDDPWNVEFDHYFNRRNDEMKIRAKSVIKLTDGNANIDYTFVSGATLEHVAKQLLIQLTLKNGKESVIELTKKTLDTIE